MISPNGWLLLILTRISIPGIPIHRSAMEPGTSKRIINSNLPVGEGVLLKGDPSLRIRQIKNRDPRNRHLKSRHHRNRCHRGSRRKSNQHSNSRSSNSRSNNNRSNNNNRNNNNRSSNSRSSNRPGREGASREGNLTSHSSPTRVSQARNRIAREANVSRTGMTVATTTGAIIGMTVSGNPGEWISTTSRG